VYFQRVLNLSRSVLLKTAKDYRLKSGKYLYGGKLASDEYAMKVHINSYYFELLTFARQVHMN
jgi:hypothetical protein